MLIINDGASNYYYFVVKNLPELNSSEWLRRRKEIIINGYNTFQKALDDALNYQNIETHSERISKIKSYVIKYNWKGIEFPVGKNLNKIIRQLLLMYYLYHTMQKQ